MNIITQEARKRQAVVKFSMRKGKSFASRIYGVSLASVKRWCKRYDGSWKSYIALLCSVSIIHVTHLTGIDG